MKYILCLIVFLAIPFADAHGEVVVKAVRLSADAGRTRVVFDLSGTTRHNVFALGGPSRVVIDFDGARLGRNAMKSAKAVGLLSGIRSAPRRQGGLRVVLDLTADVQARSFLLRDAGGNVRRLVVDLLAKSAAAKPLKAAVSVHKTLVIAIDPGHGGGDPGATGPAGVHEKDVVLAVARKLAHLVDRQPGMRAILTRRGDYYLTLRQRTREARKARADIFISIHADASRDPHAAGATVYTLSRRGATSEAARVLAKRENAADTIGGVSLDDKGDLVATVLVDLSKNATAEASMHLGENVMAALDKLGKMHRAKVERAAFVVLKSLDIPSILVETAYITNPHEERELRSDAYQWDLARAIAAGLERYVRTSLPPGMRVAQPHEHRIRQGETLTAIADEYRVSLERLRRVNHLSGDTIVAGDTLVIP